MFATARRRVPGRPRLGWAAAGLAALALIAAACTAGGSASSGAGAYGAAPASSATPPAAAVVDLRGSRLGQMLVDGQGRSLYLFEADQMGRSTCNAACASAWPPYLSNGAPKAGKGVAGGQLSTTVRAEDGGGTQVTYKGHPLYYYVGDGEPGDTAGQGLDQFGARWYVVAASGDKIVGD